MKSKMNRTSKPLSDYLGSLGQANGCVREWSLARAEILPIKDPDTDEIRLVPNKNRKIYHEKPVIEEKDLLEAYEYKQRDKTIIKLQVHDQTT